MPRPGSSEEFVDEVLARAGATMNRHVFERIREMGQDAREKLGASARAREMTFARWATSSHFTADREPVSLIEWPHLKPLYDAVPVDPIDLDICVMKAAQCGASIWAMLLTLYVALTRRCQLGYFLPTKDHAMIFSNERFLRLCRDNQAIYAALGDLDAQQRALAAGRVANPDEGSKSVRRIMRSVVYFTYMGGVVTTESLPLDGLIFDEVQEMLLREIEKTEERIAASSLKLRVRVSTANFQGADIDYYYQRSTQETWVTRCGCQGGVILADQWDPEHGPLCIKEFGRIVTWVCPHCSIEVDPKVGKYVAQNPGMPRRGFHFPQFCSPRQTAASILTKWRERVDTKNFYNRVLGRPFTDPKTQPIGEQHLAGAQDDSLTWGPLLERSDDVALGSVVMGIDQMGHDNHVVIACRWYDRMRVLYAEIVRSGDPWARCAQLMRQYRVRVCAVEALPNFNEAHRFARAHDGRVWVVNYTDLIDQMVTWGDRPRDKVSIRKTDEEARARYVATCDQYRMMAWSLGQWTHGRVVTPDARGLWQELPGEAGRPVPTAIWRDVFWLHMQRVALVTEEVQGRESERRLRRCVKKIGIDPHFAYTWMLLCLAWTRIYGTEQLLPIDLTPDAMTRATINLPPDVSEMERGYASQIQEHIAQVDTDGPIGRNVSQLPPMLQGLGASINPADMATVCGTCTNFRSSDGVCTARNLIVTPALPACDYYQSTPLVA